MGWSFMMIVYGALWTLSVAPKGHDGNACWDTSTSNIDRSWLLGYPRTKRSKKEINIARVNLN